MNNYPRLVFLLCSALSLVLPMHASAESTDAESFVNKLTESGRCGHEKVGKLQYLKNPDQSNSYEVTVKTIEMREGKEKETLKSFHIKAGGKKHLGCTLSDVMPLSSYKRVIVKETR